MPTRVNLPDGRVVNFPDGMSPADMEQAIATLAPAPAPKTGPNWAEAPSLGGMAGGIGGFLLGGPIGAIAGATLGGGLGSAAEAHFGPEKADAFSSGLAGIVGGAGQGALEAIPQGMGRLLTRTAPHVMDMGLKRTAADRLEFPNTPKRLVQERIIPRGQNVQNALSATEAKVNADALRFDLAHPIGPVDPDSLAQSGRDFAHKEGRVGGLGNVPGPESAELDALQRGYQAQNTRSRSLEETIDQKRAYQARAKYNSRPNAPTATNNELNFNKGVAEANRSEAIRLNPALEGDLAKEQDLIGALTAQKNAEAKATPLSTIGTLKTVAGLRNPLVMGSSAIGLDRMGRALRSPITPNLVRAFLIAQMHGQEP